MYFDEEYGLKCVLYKYNTINKIKINSSYNYFACLFVYFLFVPHVLLISQEETG